MSGKAFLDTNIFVYANDRCEPRKQPIALRLIREVTLSGNGAVSYQVVQGVLQCGVDQDAAEYLRLGLRLKKAAPRQ